MTDSGSHDDASDHASLPTPQHAVTLVKPTSVEAIGPSEVTPDLVGWKAYGLSCIPGHWTVPFVVVHASAAARADSTELSSLLDVATQTLRTLSGEFIVRSSGTSETLGQRGRLDSRRGSLESLPNLVRALSTHLAAIPDVGIVHFVVQPYVTPLAAGHFSNERHVSSDRRDWVFEVDSRTGSPAYSTRVAVRRWRDGQALNTTPLVSRSEAGLSVAVKSVALWAEGLARRVHFEWVWDGTKITLVQCDLEDTSGGVRPRDTVVAVSGDLESVPLKVFRKAEANHYKLYRKLRNVAIYQDLGYDMPPFYVIDHQDIVRSLAKGDVPDDLIDDLKVLTQRPLVIRTDGTNIPAEQREMLPRSEELRTLDAALSWLTKEFADRFEAVKLSQCDVCLLAHHYIPAVASAWAQATPGRRLVRVESLWGIPEGLYWFSHDTFEVDTARVAVSVPTAFDGTVFRSSERIRHKGKFIAPDAEGRWRLHETAVPDDWMPTVSEKLVLSEIAWTTRQIAELQGTPVTTMWFVGTAPGATPHKVLPWFHQTYEPEGEPRAAPRRKYKRSKNYEIKTVIDWDTLREHCAEGRRVERVVVDPTDPVLFRHQAFVNDLAELAAEHDFVIELSGGVLSHAYYMLRRKAKKVEIVDLFGVGEETLEFDKLVRDSIPATIVGGGEKVATAEATGDALIVALKRKLVEETFEALDTTTGAPLIEELADILEVARALCDQLGVTYDELEAIREEKLKRRGGFSGGVILFRTSTPGSLVERQAGDDGLLHERGARRVISRMEDLPQKMNRRRPDTRAVPGEGIEKLLRYEVDIPSLDMDRQQLTFSFPGVTERNQQYTLMIEIERHLSGLRVAARVRALSVQLDLLDA